jgi:hypothetical protein
MTPDKLKALYLATPVPNRAELIASLPFETVTALCTVLEPNDTAFIMKLNIIEKPIKNKQPALIPATEELSFSPEVADGLGFGNSCDKPIKETDQEEEPDIEPPLIPEPSLESISIAQTDELGFDEDEPFIFSAVSKKKELKPNEVKSFMKELRGFQLEAVNEIQKNLKE